MADVDERIEIPFEERGLATLAHLSGLAGYIFPLGVYSLATLQLGDTVGVSGFAWLGALLVMLLGLIWVVVAALTLRGAYRGELFVAPCLAAKSPH